MPTKKWTITMDDFNIWKKIIKEKKLRDKILDGKVKIIPEKEEDKEVAQQLETLINHHLSKDKVK